MFYYTLNETKKTRLCFFTDGKKNKASELDMITLRNHAPRSYTTWLPVTLTWLLNNLQLWHHRHGFQKLTVYFRPIRKEIVSTMYSKYITLVCLPTMHCMAPSFCLRRIIHCRILALSSSYLLWQDLILCIFFWQDNNLPSIEGDDKTSQCDTVVDIFGRFRQES